MLAQSYGERQIRTRTNEETMSVMSGPVVPISLVGIDGFVREEAHELYVLFCRLFSGTGRTFFVGAVTNEVEIRNGCNVQKIFLGRVGCLNAIHLIGKPSNVWLPLVSIAGSRNVHGVILDEIPAKGIPKDVKLRISLRIREIVSPAVLADEVVSSGVRGVFVDLQKVDVTRAIEFFSALVERAGMAVDIGVCGLDLVNVSGLAPLLRKFPGVSIIADASRLNGTSEMAEFLSRVRDLL